MKIANFMQNPKGFLIYCGSPGIGKTHLCAALMEWAMTEFENFRYWHEIELLKRIRSSMDQYEGDYIESLQYFIDDELVFLDDIGSSGLREWREEVLFKTIDERYNSMKPTIITSNFSKKEFIENYHERLGSRLFSIDNVLIEINDGADQRQHEKT